MSSQRHHELFPAAPFMALDVVASPIRDVAQPIHVQQKYERFYHLQPSVEARLPPVVDHVVVCANVLAFVSVAAGGIAGVRVSAPSPDAVEAIDVRVHRDTGLEVYAKSNGSTRILVELFLPTPTTLRLVEARDHAVVVVESALANDALADVRIHHVGECAIFVSSRAPMHVKSLTLDPQAGGLIQVITPALQVSTVFQANVPALGKIRVFTGKLTAPVVTMDTAGYGSVQLAALAIDASTTIAMSAVGQSHVATVGDHVHAALLKASVSGMGNVDVLASHEMTVRAVECVAQGAAAVRIASHYAHCDVSRLSVAGKGVVDARDVVAREANIHAMGAATAVFRASERAHTTISGYGTATLVGVVPPNVTGRPCTSPAMPSLVEELAATRTPPVATPLQNDAFEHRETAWSDHAQLHLPSLNDFTAALKALWGGHRDAGETAPTTP